MLGERYVPLEVILWGLEITWRPGEFAALPSDLSGSQHPLLATHSGLKLQLQGIWCHLLASVATALPCISPHIETNTHTHLGIKSKNKNIIVLGISKDCHVYTDINLQLKKPMVGKSRLILGT